MKKFGFLLVCLIGLNIFSGNAISENVQEWQYTWGLAACNSCTFSSGAASCNAYLAMSGRTLKTYEDTINSQGTPGYICIATSNTSSNRTAAKEQYLLFDENNKLESCPVGNPINPVSGEKYEASRLISIGTIHPINFDIYFNSGHIEKWSHSYSRSVTLNSADDEPRYNFVNSTFNAEPETPESNGGFGFDSTVRKAKGVDVNAPVSTSYTYRSFACSRGWSLYQRNYHFDWVSTSKAEYAGGGLCNILDTSTTPATIKKKLPIYSKFRGKRTVNSTYKSLRYSRGDGKVVKFELEGGAWVNKSSTGERAEIKYEVDGVTVSGYRFHTENDKAEDYNAQGQLEAITSLDGHVQRFFYESHAVTGLSILHSIQNETGESLSFDYEVFGANNDLTRLSRLTDNTNRVWKFEYDLKGNLELITNPDLSVKRHHYENTSHPYKLTGITDERGIRYSSWNYNSDGKAIYSAHGPNKDIERVNIDYLTYGNRTVTKVRTSADGLTFENIPTTYTTHTAGGAAVTAKISGPGCSTCGISDVEYEHDSLTGNLEYKIEKGLKTEYGNYNDKGQPGFIIEAAGTTDARRTDYTYDARFHNKVTTITEPSVFTTGSKVTTFTYDDFGNTTTTAITGFKPDGTALSRTVTAQYNGPYHQVSEIDGPRVDVNDITTFAYYPNDVSEGANRSRLRFVRSFDGVNLRRNITYTATGQIESEGRPNNLHIDYVYYAGNDRLAYMIQTDTLTLKTRKTRWTYLPTGEVETVTQAPDTLAETTVTLHYDGGRRLDRITDGLGNYIEYKLDSEGNVEHENIHDAAGVLTKTLTQTFDSYDRMSNFTQLNESQSTTYNTDGTIDTTTDGKAVISKYGYDGLKRLTSLTQDQGGTNAETANTLTQYGYDVQNNLTSVTDANNGQTSYVYDDLGNLLSRTSPDTGTVTYTHDAAGNTASATDAKLQLFTYNYDVFNRLTTSDSPATEDDVTYTFDNCAQGFGRLCTIVRNNSTLSYKYNGFGDVTSIDQALITETAVNQAINSVAYGYDAAARLSTMTYPSGAIIQYHYNNAGEVNRVTLEQNSIVTDLSSSISYFPFGAAKTNTYGNALTVNGVYDTAYRPTDIGLASTYIDTISSYDANGNILSSSTNEGVNTVAQTFAYDELLRLNTSNGYSGDFIYDYDKVGNRTSKTQDTVTTTSTYEPNSNRLSLVTDANGNVTSIRNISLTFTADNRLKSSGSAATYEYNGQGQRTIKHKTAEGAAGALGYNQTTAYIYGLSGELIAETGPTGRVVKEYVYLNGQPFVMLSHSSSSGESFLAGDLDKDGVINVEDVNVWHENHRTDVAYEVTGDGLANQLDIDAMTACKTTPGSCTAATTSTMVYYIHNDHLGTPKVLTDSAGQTVWRATATPFGDATVNEDVDGDGLSVVMNIRQPGQYFDGESGFYYNYFRYYDPETGRYITSDPIGLAGGINTYGYVGGNPLNDIDPYGLMGALGQALGGLVRGGATRGALEGTKQGTKKIIERSLSNKETRDWYKDQLKKSLDKIKKPTESNARKACEIRNDVRTQARDLMKDQKLRRKLDRDSPNKDFDFYKNKYQSQGLKGKKLWEKIIEKAKESNKNVDRSLGS